MITSATLSLAETYRFRDPKRARELLRPALEVASDRHLASFLQRALGFLAIDCRGLSGCRKPAPEIARRRARTRVRAKSIAAVMRVWPPWLGPGAIWSRQPPRRACARIHRGTPAMRTTGAGARPCWQRPDRTRRHHTGWPRSRHRHLSDRRPRPRLHPASIVAKASPCGTTQRPHHGRGRGLGTREAGSTPRPTCPRTSGLPHRGRLRVAGQSRSCPRRSSHK